MPEHRFARATLLIALIVLPLVHSGNAAATAPRKTLRPFASDEQISALFRKWTEERDRLAAQDRAQSGALMSPSPSAPMAKASEAMAARSASPTAPSESVTNVQHAGVDEGGIVKLHGDHLVILRRGRLFTVKIGGQQLTPVAAIEAFGSGIDPRGAWYDEMLISGDTIVVIGYSYARGGTEIGLFEISPAGELKYRSTYHLRSNDYYSSRNYASRLIGTQLVFYTPLRLNPWHANPFPSFPALRRWQPGATAADFKRIAPATRIYRTDEDLDPYGGVALHTVAVCDLAKPELECTSNAVLGPPGRVFYVSEKSVYVWTSASRNRGAGRPSGSAVFRIPLDGSAPSALKTAGMPIDQFSFLESDGAFLNVLLRETGGDGMWSAERGRGALALMRVPLSSFSDGRESAPRSAYRALPTPAGSALHSRYIGPFLIYGAGTGWSRPQASVQSHVYAIRYAGDAAAHEVALVHGVDRIEALGSNALVAGTDGKDLHLTSLRLGSNPEPVDRYTRANAAQGETRSHGFYYRAEGEESGLLGLPIIGGGQSASGQLRRPSASLLYVRNRALSLTEIGTLQSRAETGQNDDACLASCVDWYGNSRPLFVGKRIFALLGYEIVEGSLSANGINEARRISYAPHWLNHVR